MIGTQTGAIILRPVGGGQSHDLDRRDRSVSDRERAVPDSNLAWNVYGTGIEAVGNGWPTGTDRNADTGA